MTKDEIDAVSMTLLVNGDRAFQIYLTRGGLTQRQGSSDRPDPSALLIKGGTDLFEPFLSAMPDAVLQQEGGVLDDGATGSPRHEWRFEFGGGMQSLIYDVAYDPRSAALPDEFADIVVLAERLTHTWHAASVAEETGVPVPAVTARPAPPAPKGVPAAKGKGPAAKKAAPSRPSGTGAARGKPGQLVPAKRERIALAILLDLFAWWIPFSFLAWLFGGGGEGSGPPGAGIVFFGIVEFLLLMMARRSPGFWLLGMSFPHGEKPQVDTGWTTRESTETLTVGVVSCGLGVAGLTSWTLYHTAVPWFGLGFPPWLSIPLVVLGSVGLMLAGGLVLRLDLRGVWLGGALAILMLLTGIMARADWGTFVDLAVASRSAYEGRPVGDGLFGAILAFFPILVMVGPALLAGGVLLSWKRLTRGPVVAAEKGPKRG
jgi:hypothetical protein